MDLAIVLLSVFGVFIPALVLPGPDFVAVARSSIMRGTRAGLLTTCGVSLGLGFYATLSLVGLSALLVEYQWLTWIVRALGGSYLVYLGIRLMLSRPAIIECDGDADPRRTNAVLFGFLVTLTNPKAIVLFASVFATAVTPETPTALLVAMIMLVMMASFIWYSLVALFMSSSHVSARLQRVRHWVERTAGLCFVLIGGKVLADARNPVAP
ncbi:MAG: LysE family translocator [Pseudomonadota bacterium]